MADWPLRGEGGRHIMYGAVPASTSWVSATSGAAHTKGAYAQVVASTDIDGMLLLWFIGGNWDGFLRRHLIDIAIGGAGSEQIIISNYMFEVAGTALWGNIPILFPINIPRGTRIAARHQSDVASSPLYISASIIAPGFTTPGLLGRCTTYGAVTATTKGTSIDPGATANTKGAYVQLTASCDKIRELVLLFGMSQNSVNEFNWYIDIAIGAAASEQVILSNIPARAIYDSFNPFSFGPIPISIPAGNRIAARAQCGVNTATVRIIEVELIGIW